MWAAIGQYVGGKVLTAILIVATFAAGIWIYHHPEQVKNLWDCVKSALVWLGFALILPWALFFLVAKVRAMDSNAAGAGLLIGYLALDILAALYLAEWHVNGALTWMVLILGFLAAGVYNFIVSDWIATRLDDADGL